MNGRRLDLLFTTARFYPYVGGTEVHTLEVGRRMAARGHRVTVLAADLDDARPASEELDGVRIERVHGYPRDRDYYVAPGLWNRIRGGSWDLVHCQGYHNAVAPISMLAARGRFPYVLSFHSGGHSSWLRRQFRPIQHAALAPLVRGAARAIGVSAWETAFFTRRFALDPARVTTIPNGTSLPEMDAAAPVRTDGTIICSIGRLERYKGHHRVIKALPHLRRVLPGVRLRIVGQGPYEERLHLLALEYGVADAVEFSFVPAERRADLTRLLQEAALVVILSDYESHGMAAHEALALGRRVLVLNRAALAELASEPNVRAVPATASSGVLADAIYQVLLQPLANARPPALPHWDDIADRLEALYYEVAKG